MSNPIGLPSGIERMISSWILFQEEQRMRLELNPTLQ